MQIKIHKTFAFSVFIVFSLMPTLWLLWVNLAEIIDRAQGRYTFFAQVATLSDDEAILYCSSWALLFIFICYLSARSLIKEKYVRAIIFALIVFFTAILSVYIDTLFYFPPI